MNRYHVVAVGKYNDGPARIRAILAWAIADSTQANRCVSQKYDNREDAERDAERLNTGVAVTHADMRDRLLRGLDNA